MPEMLLIKLPLHKQVAPHKDLHMTRLYYINSIKEYGITIQKNHNARDLYFKGLFGGIPTTSYVDFEEIKYVLEDSEEKEEKNNGEET